MLLYEQWFSHLPQQITHNVYRLTPDSFSYNNSLGNIQDIPCKNFLSLCKNSHITHIHFTQHLITKNKEGLFTVLNDCYTLLKNADPLNTSLFNTQPKLSILAQSASLKEYLAFTKHKQKDNFIRLKENLTSILDSLLMNLKGYYDI